MKKLILILGIALLFMVPVAQASTIWNDPTTVWDDPATLHIGSPPNTGTYLFGTEVRPISDTSLGMLMNGNGVALSDPVWLILGIPNVTTFTTSLSYGLSSTSNPLYLETLNAGEEVYSILGVGDATNNSNSFGNWADADLAVNGITADFFGIFGYALDGTGFADPTNPINVAFASALPTGTFAIGWGQAYNEHSDKYTAYSTPFTESGLTRKTPEPSSLLLMGMGLLGLGFFGRKKS